MNKTIRAVTMAWAGSLSMLAGCMHAKVQEGAAVQPASASVRVLNMSPALDAEQRAQLRPSGLPAVGSDPQRENPYRGQAGVIEAGRSVFHTACARCHGAQAVPTPEAPDLRRLNGFCRRVQDEALKDRCLSDVDRYFQTTLMEGKVRAGVVYMPSWQGVLSPEAVWAVRTYLESLKPPGPSLLPGRAGDSAS